MFVRRALFYAQFGAVIVLPAWLLIGRGIVYGDAGWDLVALVLASPILALFLAVILGLTCARASVRRARAVSWPDAGLLLAWYAAIVAAGFMTHPVLAVLVVVLSVTAFWVQLWQLIAETRERVNRALGRMTQNPGADRAEYRIIRVHADR